jgi:hypothetical protein
VRVDAQVRWAAGASGSRVRTCATMDDVRGDASMGARDRHRGSAGRGHSPLLRCRSAPRRCSCRADAPWLAEHPRHAAQAALRPRSRRTGAAPQALMDAHYRVCVRWSHGHVLSRTCQGSVAGDNDVVCAACWRTHCAPTRSAARPGERHAHVLERLARESEAGVGLAIDAMQAGIRRRAGSTIASWSEMEDAGDRAG